MLSILCPRVAVAYGSIVILTKRQHARKLYALAAPPSPLAPSSLPCLQALTCEFLHDPCLCVQVHGGNPLAKLCHRYGIPTHKLDGHCPLHDVAEGGALMSPDADTQAEKLFNQVSSRAWRIMDPLSSPLLRARG